MNAEQWEASENPAQMLSALTSNGNAGRWPRVSERKLRLFAVACVRQVWDRLTDQRSRQAVEVAERYADGAAMFAEMELAMMSCAPSRGSNFGDGWAWELGLEDARQAAIYTSRYFLATDHQKVLPATQADLLRQIIGSPHTPYAATVPCPGCDGTGEVGPCGLTDYYRQCYRCGDASRNLAKGSGRVPAPWLTPTVLNLAAAAYDQRRDDGAIDNDCLLILCDALLESGLAEDGACSVCDGSGWFQDAGCPNCGSGNAFEQGSGRVPSPLLASLRSEGVKYRGLWSLDAVLGKS